MKLSHAFICIDCETLTENSTQCPKCGGSIVHPLAKWLESIGKPAASPDAHLCHVGTE